MEPRIQYAQTADGVSIAFWTLGDGMPLVQMVPWVHLHLEWESPEARRWYERLGESRMVVGYDSRGIGLSEHDVDDYSFEANLLDLDAVVSRVGLETFALMASVGAGALAIAYAVRHPEQVSRLILWCSWARGSDFAESPQIRGLKRLADENWELFTQTMAHVVYGWSESGAARRFAAEMREILSPERAAEDLELISQWDVADLLPQLACPTLVFHRRQAPFPKVAAARYLAASIPKARLALVEGDSVTTYGGDMDAVLKAIDEFLGEAEEEAAGAEPLAKEDVHTILFTDMEGSTTLTQRLGDAKAQEVLRTHNTILRDALKAHGGSEIKHTGDGIMASFTSASRALESAIAIQTAFAQHNESADEPIRVRIGLNAGEPVAEEKDLFGTAVQLAARICAGAEPTEILASNVVRELAAGKGFLFADRGDVALRGFEDPVRLFEVRWREG